MKSNINMDNINNKRTLFTVSIIPWFIWLNLSDKFIISFTRYFQGSVEKNCILMYNFSSFKLYCVRR